MSLYSNTGRGRPVVISGGLGRINKVSRVLSGMIVIHAYPAVFFEPEEAFWPQIEAQRLHPTVRFYLHSLNWIDFIVDRAAGLPESEWTEEVSAGAEFVWAVAWNWWEMNHVTPEWKDDEYVWGGHAVAIRAASLSALSEIFPEDEWLHEAIEYHGKWLLEHFDGYWNHGLTQALALMVVGDRLSDESMLTTGAERAKACLEVMIDEEGAINEQAPEYANYIERLRQTAVDALELFGAPGADALRAKKEPLEEFIAHSLTPGGTFVEIGDSMPRRPEFVRGGPVEFALSNGATGVEIPRVKVYDAGYVFGRSGFGQLRAQNTESFYSLRFGPARDIHGHFDHLSLTFWDRGRNVIVDAGHPGYARGQMRDYAQSRQAHNVLMVRGKEHNPDEASRLVSHQVEETWSAFDLEDTAWEGLKWKRSACFADCGPFVIADSLEPTPKVEYAEQRWNVAPEFEYVGSQYETVRFRSVVDGTQLVFIRYGIEGSSYFEHTDVNMARGDCGGLRGIVFRNEQPTDTWTVGFGRASRDFGLLTAVVVAGPEEKVEYTFKDSGPGTRVLRIVRGPQTYLFEYDIQAQRVRALSVPVERGYTDGGLTPR
ncbi:heparinase II/III family protein [Corynebacterium sp. MSK218]|uniref:heparinase II/III domain-containing protein n=1 Tax=Corynebacterium sp. MSK218 TaxID=3050218 RepID=UPI002550BE8D|nr:heparinase II/III family protein [Corynebacterium sp. MSK218]MDK8762755.1 heparinase II/III family protein [Corynebacterium sp. MSK218]